MFARYGPPPLAYWRVPFHAVCTVRRVYRKLHTKRRTRKLGPAPPGCICYTMTYIMRRLRARAAPAEEGGGRDLEAREAHREVQRFREARGCPSIEARQAVAGSTLEFERIAREAREYIRGTYTYEVRCV